MKGLLFRNVTLACVAASLAGCQMMAKYTFAPQKNQEAMVRQGREAVMSRQARSTVILAPTSRTSHVNSRPEFVAMIQNTGKAPVTFRYSEITAMNAVTDQPLKVFSLDDLQSEARTAAVVSAILIGAAGVAAGAAAAQNAGTTYGSGSINGPYGASTYTWQTYNPAAAQLTASAYGAASGAAAGATLAAGERRVQDLEASVLVDQTLMPGEWYGGFMTIQSIPLEDTTKPREYVVRVQVGQDTHVFVTTATTARPG